MIFSGLPLSQVLAIAGAAGAAIVVLYLLKMRRRAVAVPFSRIWDRVLKDEDATSLISRLKRLLSLLLQLALLALLLLALGDPRLSAALVTGRSIVVLVDCSASMQSTDVAPSRLEAARGRAREMARGLSGSDRMLIAQMDAATTPLSTLTSDTTELMAALDKIAPTEARADFPRALRFATDTLRGHEKAEIIVLSDGALGPAHDALGDVHVGDTKVSWVKLGERGDNAGITQFSVRRYPLDKSRYEVMIEVTNTHDQPKEIELSLLGDGDLVDVTKLRLGPNERLPRFYPNLSGASRALEARLRNADGSRDDLPADDVAFALLPERRRVRVQAVTVGNTYLDAALLLDEYLDVKTVAPSAYPAPGKFDVTIFDGVAPKRVDAGHALYLAPRGEHSPVKLGKELREFGFDQWDKKSPLLRWMLLDTIGVDEGSELLAEPGDRAVASYTDDSGKKRAILVDGKRDGARFVALGFDPRRSDIVLRVAWPLFLLNVINELVEEDTRYISSFSTGEVWKIPAPSGLSSLEVTTPSGAVARVAVQEGRAALLGQRAGVYQVRAPGVETAFAANLSSVDESTISPPAELVVDSKPSGPPSAFTVGVRRELWLYLLAAAVLLSLLEWLTYHRRVTV